MRWKRVKLSEAMEMGGPGKRWGHTLNAIRGGKLLYLFGGYGRDNCQTNQVHVYDTVSQSWSVPYIKGKPPTPRDSHTCTTIGDNLFVFGGTDGVNPLKDLHILDTSSNTWIAPSVRGEAPDPREGHSATLIGKRLFIFGGCGKSKVSTDEVYYNDLYILNTETFVWQHAVTSGIPPSARDSHTCSSWGSKMIVVGGEDGHDYYLSDVHILDTDNLVWRELNVSGNLLPPRAGHSAVAFDKYLFIFGGFSDEQNLYDDLHMLDIETGTWTKILATGEAPSARFSMAGDCLDPTISGALVFIGGCNKSLEALDDMYFLYTDLVREYHRDEKRLEKLSLRKQLKMKCQERYVPASSSEKGLIPFGSPDPHDSAAYSQHGQQYFHLNEYQPTIGKRTFHAKVTNNLVNGFTIETVIDGKPLRGILFSDKPLSSITPSRNPSGETDAGKIGAQSNGVQEPKTDFPAPKDPQTEAMTTASATKGPESSIPDKSKEAAAGTPVLEKDPNVNLQEDHKADEAADSSKVSEKNSSVPQDSNQVSGKKSSVPQDSSKVSEKNSLVLQDLNQVSEKNSSVPQDLNQVSGKNSSVPEDTSKPTSQGEKDGAETAAQPNVVPSCHTH